MNELAHIHADIRPEKREQILRALCERYEQRIKHLENEVYTLTMLVKDHARKAETNRP